ncbi:antitoxin VapB family protein [Candidatus Micrarchaeota archaeon]|nr:antitoxin VapB family protein [Candidatus Micrarchaeota archaeon]
MGYRNISVSDAVYLRLAALKSENESFNAFLSRMAEEKKSLKDFWGAWEDTPETAKSTESNLKLMWGTWNERVGHRPSGRHPKKDA